MDSAVFLARQPIVNINKKIIGYELLFRDSRVGIQKMPSNTVATTKIVYNTLSHMDLERLIKPEQKAFINCDHEIILEGILDFLDPEIFVIELLETTEVTPQLVTKIKELRSVGFQIAIDDFDCKKSSYTRFEPLLPYVHLIKVCIRTVDLEKQSGCIELLKTKKIPLLAEKIETKEEMVLCIKMGFTLFQGYFIAKPEVLEKQSFSDITKAMILKLIMEIKRDSETHKIVTILKSYPDLSLSLMKFASNTLRNLKITSLHQLVTMIGRADLIKWCLLYLKTEMDSAGISDNLINLALARASAMESKVPSELKEKAYIVGLISALAVVFEAEAEEVLTGIKLEKVMKVAITTQTGEMGIVLKDVVEEERKDLIVALHKNMHLISTSQLVKFLEECKIEY